MEKRKEILNERLKHRYDSIEIDKSTCFIINEGIVCRIASLGGEYNALVIEYADNLEKANRGLFGEDGDLFYMDELDEDKMFDAIIKEIDNI